MVFKSPEAIALPIVVGMVAVIVIMLMVMITLIHKEGHQPSIHLVTTKMPPELTLETSMIWHLL